MKEQKRKTFNFIFFYWGISLLMGISVCYFLFSKQEIQTPPAPEPPKPCSFIFPPKIDVQPIVEDETVRFKIFEPIENENEFQMMEAITGRLLDSETSTIAPGESPIPKTPNEYFIHFDEMMKEVKREPIPDVVNFHESIFSISALSNNPAPLNKDEISKLIGFPRIARDAGITGIVILEIEVDKDGFYKHHKVIKDPHPILTKAVEKHISKLRFEIGYINHKPVSYLTKIPYNFVCTLN